ncbi:hypothetical protein INS49_009620 [Diaporthe citri]|uniref:uncharacterized protein n=1 Tax=Diaporthe citri TaxID=83186 RepID=UPI001C818301|nr:uncharacterized protein INS49_009620 [Diaporthe citri]KAG6361393.1 hypothetical protein INS49_009620 [Diaporthe citri]
MPRKFTFEQVGAHNNSHPNNKYAVIHGDVYRIASIPFGKCLISSVAVEAALVNGLDVSALFGSGHKDGSTLRLLKSTQGCHVGTIVQAPAGAPGGQPAQPAQPGPPGQQGRNGQPDADDDEGGTAAERRRREEARNRRLRKTYNPLMQDPDDADEYPADAVAMGYLPDFEGRRWRERRMRLSRYIQYNDIPAIDEEDIDPGLAAALDLDFAKEIRYQRNLKGGEARGCTGSFRAARPPPPRSQLRPRDGGRTPGGPPPRDPPDSDADDDDGDDDAPGAPAAAARQVQVEGRVRQWFPSNSNRAGLGPTHLPTPPVTPLNPLAQPTVRPPVQPPPPPPQHPQQLTPPEEEEIAKQRRADESAAADKAILKKAKDPKTVKEVSEKFWSVKPKTKAKRAKPEEKSQGSEEQPTRRQDEQARKQRREQRKKEEEQRKAQEEQKKKKDAADEANRQKTRKQHRRRMDKRSEYKNSHYSDWMNLGRKQYRMRRDARMRRKGSKRSRVGGYTLGQAKDVIRDQYGELVEDPDKKARNKSTTTTPKGPKEPTTKTPPKRSADTTEGDQGSSKKLRSDDSQKTKRDQTSSGGKYGDGNRPYKKGEEPWNKGKGPQNKTGLLISRSDDEDSPDELGPPVVTTGGPAQPPDLDVPDLPSDLPRAPTTTGTADTGPLVPVPVPVPTTWPPNLIRPPNTNPRPPTVIPPPGGIPTTTTSTTTGGPRPGGARGGVGFRPGSSAPDRIKDLFRKRDNADPSNGRSTKR